MNHSIHCHCLACLAKWAEYEERRREAERMLTESVLTLPATDREWQEYLDAEFPREPQRGADLDNSGISFSERVEYIE